MSAPDGAPTILSEAQGTALVRYAAAAVWSRLSGVPADGRPPMEPALRALGASFVTLERDGSLRGCIGTLEAARPLYRDVTRNAVRAAADPRLPPVNPTEWSTLDISVSVLSRTEPLAVQCLKELWAALRPGVDGLILIAGPRRATFLPAVWAKLPEPDAFVAALLIKGGWPRDELPLGASVRRYTTISFHDAGPRSPLP